MLDDTCIMWTFLTLELKIPIIEDENPVSVVTEFVLEGDFNPPRIFNFGGYRFMIDTREYEMVVQRKSIINPPTNDNLIGAHINVVYKMPNVMFLPVELSKLQEVAYQDRRDKTCNQFLLIHKEFLRVIKFMEDGNITKPIPKPN